jgi:hypothetical protein
MLKWDNSYRSRHVADVVIRGALVVTLPA